MLHAVLYHGLALMAIFLLANESIAEGLGITPPDQISTLAGFQAELVYEVPQEQQGSWVNLTVDPQGRLIASDQHGGLYRIDLRGGATKVEKLSIEIVGAQGLLCAFGSLYANVNHNEFPAGIWRLTDTDGDDQYDKKEHILALNAGGEHGPHAMILSPDQQRILMCAGNNTNLPNNIARRARPARLGRRPSAGPDARCPRSQRQSHGAGWIHSFDEPRWQRPGIDLQWVSQRV